MARVRALGNVLPQRRVKNAHAFRRTTILSGLQRQKDSGLLVTLGPTEGSSHVFAESNEADSQCRSTPLSHADVYWREGIWTGGARSIPLDLRRF